MTYLESYNSVKTIEQLAEEVKLDLLVAKFWNEDRVAIINNASLEIINRKFNGDIEVFDRLINN